LGRLWPRARSNLFNEPKKLVAHGLAVGSPDKVGRQAWDALEAVAGRSRTEGSAAASPPPSAAE